jgi:hypothetical protein
VTETVIKTVSVCHISQVKHLLISGFVLSLEIILTAFPSATRKLLDLEHWDMFSRTQFPGTVSGTVWTFWVLETTGEWYTCDL